MAGTDWISGFCNILAGAGAVAASEPTAVMAVGLIQCVAGGKSVVDAVSEGRRADCRSALAMAAARVAEEHRRAFPESDAYVVEAEKAINRAIRAALSADPDGARRAFVDAGLNERRVGESVRRLAAGHSAIFRDPAVEGEAHAVFAHAQNPVGASLLRSVAALAWRELRATGFYDGLRSHVDERLLAEVSALRQATVKLGEASIQTAEDVAETKGMVSQLLVEVRQENRALLRELGAKDEAVVRLARRILGSVADFDQAHRELDAAVDLLIEQLEKSGQPTNFGDWIDDVLARVRGLSAEGAFDEAAAEATNAFEAWKREEQERRSAEMARGLRLLDVALTQKLLARDAPSAARCIFETIDLQISDPQQVFVEEGEAFNHWFREGLQEGVVLYLELAAEIARLSVRRAPTKFDNCAVLLNLATVLYAISDRAPGSERLYEAVETQKRALEIADFSKNPLGKDQAVVFLGDMLSALSERTGEISYLDEAVAVLRRERNAVAHDRSAVHLIAFEHSLALTIQRRGELLGQFDDLREAIALYRSLLGRSTASHLYFTIQSNLGTALQWLGGKSHNPTLIREAIAAYRLAAPGYSRKSDQDKWAALEYNVANTYIEFGRLLRSEVRLLKAIRRLDGAAEVWSPLTYPAKWAMTESSRGHAFHVLSEVTGKVANLESSLIAYDRALRHVTREADEFLYAQILENKALAHFTMFNLRNSPEDLSMAKSLYDEALPIYLGSTATFYQIKATALRRHLTKVEERLIRP